MKKHKEKVAKLSKTSKNSSKSPSSDIVKQNQKENKNQGLKIGAQPGHPKHEHKLFSQDEIHGLHEYSLAQCPECNRPVETDLFVLFKIDKSRGSKVLIEVLGKEFNGILGCDYFSAYRKYMKDFNVTIQFCIAHLIRDIKYLTSLPDKESKEYGEELLSSVRELFKVIHDKDKVPGQDFVDKLTYAKDKIMRTAMQEAPVFFR